MSDECWEEGLIEAGLRKRCPEAWTEYSDWSEGGSGCNGRRQRTLATPQQPRRSGQKRTSIAV